MLVLLTFLGFCCFLTVKGQVDSMLSKKVPSILLEKNKLVTDSLAIQQNRPSIDTTPVTIPPSKTPVAISKNALDEKVEYGAKDSIKYDNSNNKVHLYGDAFVKFQTLELKAGYISISLDSNIAVANTFIDSTGRLGGKPTFSDGDAQNFQATKMRYNFKSQKGIVYDVATTQSNLFVKGNKTKFVSQTNMVNDSSIVDNILYNKNAIFSTCDAPHPHYGIRSRKQKVVADKVVVVGLSNLELGGVPTPVYLPFGFFPLKDFKSTGLIFPQGYEYSPQWGFGLDGIGWYFPISEKIDLRLTSLIYPFHGTWGLTADSRYKKRYKYNGSFNVSFSSRKSLDNPARQNSYSIRWSHNQDSKAHPTRRFSGNVNLQGNGYQERNRNDAQSVLQGTLSSNVSYNQTFPGKPFRLSAAMSHSQNTRSKKVNISLPTLNFQMNRIYPFKQNRGGNKEKWYEKVSLKYDGQFQNKFTATDTTLFTQKTLEDARFGFKHNATTDMNFNIFKYIAVSPNASFNETWYFHTIREYVDTLGNIAQDLPATFESVRDTMFGFEPWHQFTTGVSMSTNLFGTLLFKKGRLKGIRHTVKPSLSFNFTPNYTAEEGFFGGVVKEYDRDTSETVDLRRYSIFDGGIYGSPSTTSGKQMALSYSINNIFEAKFRPKRDSVDKKIKLFDNIRMGGNYNFAADSLKFSDISASGTTRLFKGITNFTFNARWTPYSANVNNRKIDKFYWRTNAKFVRFLGADFRFSTRLSVRDIKKLLNKEKTNSSTSRRRDQGNQEGGKQENSFLKFLEGFNLNHNFNFRASSTINQPTSWEIQTHNINVRVSNIQVTDNWSMTVGNIGYDFKNKRTTYPDIGFKRDLHCWEASFNWQPQRGTYYFTIRVKNAPLDMLKLPYQKNNVDAFGGF